MGNNNALNKEQITNLLPHREPMLLIDELVNIVPHKSAVGIINIKKDFFFIFPYIYFLKHFFASLLHHLKTL